MSQKKSQIFFGFKTQFATQNLLNCEFSHNLQIEQI